MSKRQRQQATLSDEQIKDSANAWLDMIELETTLIPGNFRKKLIVLEAILKEVAAGRAILVSTRQDAVESSDDTGKAGDTAGKTGDSEEKEE